MPNTLSHIKNPIPNLSPDAPGPTNPCARTLCQTLDQTVSPTPSQALSKTLSQSPDSPNAIRSHVPKILSEGRGYTAKERKHQKGKQGGYATATVHPRWMSSSPVC